MILRAERSPLVIAHDYLTQRGGAERVVSVMSRAFPGAPILTSMFKPAGTFSEFARVDVRTTSLQKVPFLPGHHRAAFPLYAPTFSRITVDTPLLLCSTSGWAHGVQSTGLKALYVHNTARWAYQTDEYLNGRYFAARAVAAPMIRPLQRWNRRAASTADKVWVNSKAVQDRVWKNWELESEVLYPPHGANLLGSQEPIDGLTPGYLIAVTRLLHYKRVDVIVEAMRHLPGHQLVVVGEGPEASRLRDSAPRNCLFLGRVSDERLRWLYANSLGLVSAAHEDLGLAPLEAMAFGRPVAVLRRGGFLETVVEGRNGLFFDESTPEAAGRAMLSLVRSRWSPADITSWADQFSEAAFVSRLRASVGELVGDQLLSGSTVS